MRFKAHLAGGVCIGLLSNLVVQNSSDLSVMQDVALVSASAFGSLLPDIDHRGSYVGRRVPLVPFILNQTLGHRGATHSPIVITLFSIFLYGIFHYFSLLQGLEFSIVFGLYIGMLSHVLLDMLTPQGVPVFYPFRKSKVSVANIQTGGLGELVLTVALVFLSIILLN